MRLVVDANIVLGGLLRTGATRELLLHAPLTLYAPEWLWAEVERHTASIARRARVPIAVTRLLLRRLLEPVQPVPEIALARHAAEALRRCQRSGAKDTPYVAACLAVDAPLWTADRRLSAEAGVETVTTDALAEVFLA